MKREDKVARNIYYHCLEYDHEQLGDLYLVACGMEDADPGVITGPDLRDGFHLHVVRSGKGSLRIAGEERQIREGQMFILKDGFRRSAARRGIPLESPENLSIIKMRFTMTK